MGKVKKIFYCLKNPMRFLYVIVSREKVSSVFSRIISDKTYLKLQYEYMFGKKLNLDNPKTFNEKIQWQKLYDRKPMYTIMVDKYEVKKYVADIIGQSYIVPTLGIYDRFEDIDFNELPQKFVLKCTHDSGGLVIVKDKDRMNVEAAKEKINKSLRKNYYYMFREWAYKDVKPRIIAEQLLEDGKNLVPEDYKIYCMNGEPRYIVIFHNRFDDKKILCESVYNLDWEKQNFSFDEHFAISDFEVEKPKCLDELISLCKKLCANMSQVRIDFYVINNKIYFGEITLYTAAGLTNMIPEAMDEKIGELINLPMSGK